MLSIEAETLRTRPIASAKPAMRSPSWTTSSVKPLNTAIVSSIAARPAESFSPACSARLRGEDARLVGRLGDAGLVHQQAAGHVLERVERAQVGGDALGNARDVA